MEYPGPQLANETVLLFVPLKHSFHYHSTVLCITPKAHNVFICCKLPRCHGITNAPYLGNGCWSIVTVTDAK